MTVTLINTTRRMKVINLPHASYCEALGTCACTAGRGDRLTASSLTLCAGSTTLGLHEAVLQLPDVARDIRAGELRVRRDVSPPQPKSRPRKASRRTVGKKAR